MSLSTALRSVVLSVTALAAAGAGPDVLERGTVTEEFLWSPESDAGSLALAQALAIATQLRVVVDSAIAGQVWQSAKCSLRAIRPGLGESALADPQNRLGCEVITVAGNTGWVTLLLGAEPLARWGHQQNPTGVSLLGASADSLLQAFAAVSAAQPDSDVLTQVSTTVVSPTSQRDRVEWSLRLPIAGEAAAPIKLSCAHEYQYAVGAARPTEPTQRRCDFMTFAARN